MSVDKVTRSFVARLTLDQATGIAEATFRHAAALKLAPLAIAILDTGGRPILILRQDGASALRPKIAMGKASGAMALGMSSRRIAEMAQERPVFVASLAHLNEAGIVPAAGGLIALTANGLAVGAVGVSGDTSDNDEACARAGILEMGLVPLD